jgi:hypothetical protein
MFVPLNDGHWHHAALTMDETNSEIILYLNGHVTGSSHWYIPTNASPKIESIWLGTRPPSSDLYNITQLYKGYMDELFIAQFPFSGDKISQVYSSSKKYFARHKVSVVETAYVAPKRAITRLLPTTFVMLPDYTSLSFIVRPKSVEVIDDDILYFADLMIGGNNLTIGMDAYTGTPSISAHDIDTIIRPMPDRGYSHHIFNRKLQYQ